MAYLFLALSTLAGVSKGFCGKRISAYTSEFKSAAFSNLIRMLLCIAVGFFFAVFDGGISTLVPTPGFLLVSALSGVTTATMVLFWLFAVRGSSVIQSLPSRNTMSWRSSRSAKVIQTIPVITKTGRQAVSSFSDSV